MAMIPCNYYVNVAKDSGYRKDKPYYVHYCTIEFGDCMKDEAWKRYEELKELFNGNKWHLSLNYVRCTGQILEEAER